MCEKNVLHRNFGMYDCTGLPRHTLPEGKTGLMRHTVFVHKLTFWYHQLTLA